MSSNSGVTVLVISNHSPDYSLNQNHFNFLNKTYKNVFFPGDDVYDFFSSYCDVLTVERSVSPASPSLCDGNCVIKTVLEKAFRILCPSVVVNVMHGIVNSLRSGSYVVKLAIMPSPAPYLVCVAAASSWVIWPGSVRGPKIQLLLLQATLILCRTLLILFQSLLTQNLILTSSYAGRPCCSRSSRRPSC